jgi:hypothetical protein
MVFHGTRFLLASINAYQSLRTGVAFWICLAVRTASVAWVIDPVRW